MTRLVPVTVLVVLAAGSVASADKGMLPGNATLAYERLFIQDSNGKFIEPPNPDDQRLYFSRAHCLCSQASAANPGAKFQYRLVMNGTTGTARPAEFWVGTSCEDDVQRPMMCRKLDSPQIPDIDAVGRTDTKLEFSLYDVIRGNAAANSNCPQDETDKPVFLLMDTDGANGIDYSLVKNIGQLPGSTALGVDTKPPPAPESVKASPGEGAIQLSWKTPASRATDIFGYQALCSKTDGSQARTDPPKALYGSSRTLCNVPDNTDNANPLLSSDGGTSGNIPLPDELIELHTDRICGEAMAATATSLTIKHLQNGTPYNVILLAIDLHGNYTGVYLPEAITPHLVTDFWEDLHENGDSKAEGGLCLLAETYGDDSNLTRMLRAFRDDTLGASRPGRWLTEAYYATLAELGAVVHGSIALRVVAAIALAPLVALALLWHWLTLPGLLGLIAAAWWLWRRRRAARQRPWLPVRASGAIAGLAVLLALGTGRAHAGGGFQPYWEEDPTEQNKDEAADDEPGLAKWHAGIRVGPYVPDIDKQLGKDPGPYQQMFGGYRILPMLDVDRFLWTDVGQLGVGISLGYMQKTARAFAMDSDPSQPNRPREPGAQTAFRLIPLALTGTYRFTWLDDNYGVPLVPYVRGGLAYYIWWITAPSGGFARVCQDPTMNFPCAAGENKALGASLGVTGSIGLAVRAERIDASAAISMRQSGIQHAGVYAELSLAKVDGFGSDKKLSVGDRTWFAGVDFEF